VVHVGFPSSLQDFYHLSCRAGRDGLPCTSLLAHESLEGSSLSVPLDPTLVFCSAELPCRRHYLLRYLETEQSSLPSEDAVPFDECCDACDRRVVRKELSSKGRKESFLDPNAASSGCAKPAKSQEAIEQKPSAAVSHSHSSAELEMALRVARFDLCQRVGETAPYKLLSSEEIKSLSLLRPLSLGELRSQFGWNEQKVRMVGEEVLSCIRKHSAAKSSDDPRCIPPPPSPSHKIPLEDPPVARPSPTPTPLPCPLALPSDGATPGGFFGDRDQPHRILEPLVAGGSMKRRRTEALNATCGVGKAFSLRPG
jgi:superfamily II DNA helicase RecQ